MINTECHIPPDSILLFLVYLCTYCMAVTTTLSLYYSMLKYQQTYTYTVLASYVLRQQHPLRCTRWWAWETGVAFVEQDFLTQRHALCFRRTDTNCITHLCQWVRTARVKTPQCKFGKRPLPVISSHCNNLATQADKISQIHGQSSKKKWQKKSLWLKLAYTQKQQQKNTTEKSSHRSIDLRDLTGVAAPAARRALC